MPSITTPTKLEEQDENGKSKKLLVSLSLLIVIEASRPLTGSSGFETKPKNRLLNHTSLSPILIIPINTTSSERFPILLLNPTSRSYFSILLLDPTS